MSLTESEIAGFLAENRVLTLASLGIDMGPRVVPLAFLYEHGKFYVSTKSTSRKVGNITVNSKVAFCIVGDNDPYHLKAVVGKGTARMLSSSKLHDEVRVRLIMHLVGSLEHEYAKSMMDSEHVIIEITPTGMTSWQNALVRQGVTKG